MCETDCCICDCVGFEDEESRSYDMAASSENEMHRWIKAIRAARCVCVCVVHMHMYMFVGGCVCNVCSLHVCVVGEGPDGTACPQGSASCGRILRRSCLHCLITHE